MLLSAWSLFGIASAWAGFIFDDGDFFPAPPPPHTSSPSESAKGTGQSACEESALSARVDGLKRRLIQARAKVVGLERRIKELKPLDEKNQVRTTGAMLLSGGAGVALALGAGHLAAPALFGGTSLGAMGLTAEIPAFGGVLASVKLTNPSQREFLDDPSGMLPPGAKPATTDEARFARWDLAYDANRRHRDVEVRELEGLQDSAPYLDQTLDRRLGANSGQLLWVEMRYASAQAALARKESQELIDSLFKLSQQCADSYRVAVSDYPDNRLGEDTATIVTAGTLLRAPVGARAGFGAASGTGAH